MSNEFQIERARLQAELTALALVGGGTDKVRAKLAKLDEREQQARNAEAAAVEAARQDRLADAAASAECRVAEICERLTAGGNEVTDADRTRLGAMCQQSAAQFAEIGAVRDARSAVAQRIGQIASRISLLEDRRGAIAELRASGQSNDRDLIEIRGLELDLETLRAAKAEAQAELDAIAEPAGAAELRQRAERDIAALERDIAARAIASRIAEQEATLLDSIKQLVAVSGAKIPGDVYRRTPGLDWFIRTGALK
jgi:hypothetical protein